MEEFFDSRLKDYDEHQLTCINSATGFYPFTASCLPQGSDSNILDLGCGTGLEIDYYFEIVPTAKITGIDLAPGMLDVLKKFSNQSLNLILELYFDVSFGLDKFDAAVSVESLHHFTKQQKIPLYAKVKKALRNDGYFILTDYFALSDDEGQLYCAELFELKKIRIF